MVFLLKDPKVTTTEFSPSHEDQGVSSGARVRAAHTADLAAVCSFSLGEKQRLLAEGLSNVSGSLFVVIS